jgi:hypothetical protein
MCCSQGCCESLEAARGGGNRFRLHRSAGVKNYNMAVKEEGGSITFLRSVVPGATDRATESMWPSWPGFPIRSSRGRPALIG